MIPAVFSDPKLVQLQSLMGIPRCYAVGVLESMWIFADWHAPQGNIGKWPDEDIAEGIQFSGDPGTLISALVSSEWLDRHPVYRLSIRDWYLYADERAKHFLVRRSLRFIEGQKPLINQHLRINDGSKRSRRRDRMREAGEVTTVMRRQTYARDLWMCKMCGRTSDLSIDHIHPVSAGGLSVMDNLQTLCRACNSSKKDRIEVVN